MGVQERIGELVRSHPVVLFIKGTADFPMCGFSAAVVEIFRSLNVPFHCVDVIGEPEYREEVKRFTNWPTLPQVFVHGRFIGGCDITRELSGSGKLAELIRDPSLVA